MTSPPGHSDIPSALREAGLQVTAQRLAVYRAVQKHPHSMADEIWDKARSEIGSVSRQAVYNVLHTLTGHDLLRCIQPAGSPSRYEVRTDNHYHLVCRKCGEVVDTGCEQGKAASLYPADDHGYQIDEVEIIFWGICPRCQSKTKTKTT